MPCESKQRREEGDLRTVVGDYALSLLKLAHPRTLTASDLRRAIHGGGEAVDEAIKELYRTRQIVLVGKAAPATGGEPEAAWGLAPPRKGGR